MDMYYYYQVRWVAFISEEVRDRAGDVARGDWLAGFSWAQVTWQWISRIILTFGLVLSTDRPAGEPTRRARGFFRRWKTDSSPC
ncbi:hypothetical protein DAI22_02g384300 [Oryza sativa Japonica Group]|jgi:hypothetical protein|nr:hypothetical protein DAI22_02g384300 [Oryza sativa Japonica Group]